MEDKYKLEQKAFREAFAYMQDKCLVIYGIGRRTATLLPGIHDFNIVGLLDRSPENVGKIIDGVPVITLDIANENADAIIINSDPGNFSVIYERIADEVKIPVFYANGKIAEKRDIFYEENPYWKVSREDLAKAIDSHDVISFDFFDTLITRKVLTPTDILVIRQK